MACRLTVFNMDLLLTSFITCRSFEIMTYKCLFLQGANELSNAEKERKICGWLVASITRCFGICFVFCLNSSPPSAAYMRRWTWSSLVQIMLPVKRQAITWSNANLLWIGTLGTNLCKLWIENQNFPFTKMRLKMLSAKWRPFSPGVNMQGDMSVW